MLPYAFEYPLLSFYRKCLLEASRFFGFLDDALHIFQRDVIGDGVVGRKDIAAVLLQNGDLFADLGNDGLRVRPLRRIDAAV